jgi:hypothetical protein
MFMGAKRALSTLGMALRQLNLSLRVPVPP